MSCLFFIDQAAAQDLSMTPEEADAASQSAYEVGDYEAAERHALEACESGMPAACARVGFLYEWQLVGEHAGTRAAYQLAAPYYQAACDGMHIESCWWLGGFFFGGVGVDQDYQQAERFFSRACQAGHEQACAGLAATRRRLSEQWQ